MFIFKYIRLFFTNRFKKISVWGSYKLLKNGGGFIHDSAKRFIFPKQSSLSENFEEALIVHKITEDDLNHKKEQFRRQSIIYLFLSLFVFFYGCYRLSMCHYYVFFICILLTVMVLTFSFRANFWAYQIRERRLGCNFKEWFFSIIHGEA